MKSLKTHPVRLAILAVILVPLSVNMFLEATNSSLFIRAIIVALGLSPLAVAVAPRWIQFAIRGGWLAGLCWSMIGVVGGDGFTFYMWVSGFASALAIAGWVPSPAENGFSPAAFQKILSSSLMFGLADFTTLAFIATLLALHSFSQDFTLFVLCSSSAIGLAIALVGLYRMRVWGLFFCLAMNLFVMGWLFMDIVRFPDEVAFMLYTTAGIQLLLPIPIFWTMYKNFKGSQVPQLVKD